MKHNIYNVAILALSVLLSACGGSDSVTEEPATEPDDEETPTAITASITPIASLNQGEDDINSHADAIARSQLVMNHRTYTEVGAERLNVSKPNYVRIKKLNDESYIMFYHQNQIGATCYYATSSDLIHWTYGDKLFAPYAITDQTGGKNERRYANCDALVLSNGDLIAVAAFRANNGYRQRPKDAGIELKRSTDNGRTWSDPITIYQGVNWEPYLLEPTPGHIQCYFTDSSRTLEEGCDTGTAMVESFDNGKTWQPNLGENPYYVIRWKWEKNGNIYFNHQMPCVIKLNNSNELAAALETHAPAGYFISLAYSGEDGEWDHLSITEEGPSDSNNLYFSGCAPYLRQFPSGETVLSYNSASKFYMKLGDSKARTFGEAICPFTGSGYWGTLQLIDSHRIIGEMPNTSAGQVMLAEFVLNHRIKATQRTVKVDGSGADWSEKDDALFVGSKTDAQATVRVSQDADNIYLLIETLDRSPQENDYTTVMLSGLNSDGTLTTNSVRLSLGINGIRTAEKYSGGWGSMAEKKQISLNTFVCNARNTASYSLYGYINEIAIPRNLLPVTDGKLLINLGVSDGSSGLDAWNDFDENNTSKWQEVTGL